jgi:hypothetical protein
VGPEGVKGKKRSTRRLLPRESADVPRACSGIEEMLEEGILLEADYIFT